MRRIVSLLTALTLVAAAAAGGQYLQLYLRRRWRRPVRVPASSFYPASISVRQGTPFRIAAHAPVLSRMTLRRMGAELGPVVCSVDVDPTVQPDGFEPWHGMGWGFSVRIPTDGLEPGLYLASLAPVDGSGGDWRGALIVQPREPRPLKVVCSTNTWEAYNAFGGLGNYEDRATPWPLNPLIRILREGNLRWVVGDRHVIPIVPLSHLRPNEAIDQDLRQVDGDAPIEGHLVAAEWNLLRLLEREGIPYELCSDRDLALEGAGAARALVMNTHPEYWSPEMTARLTAAIAGGARIMFFSGNNLYRGVRLADAAIHVTEQKTDGAGVARLIGAAYDAYGYGSMAPYRIERPDHWAFEGVDPGRPLGAWTAPDGSAWGASGHETDKIRPEGANATVLAVGLNAEGPAYMVISETPAGGWIFNAGSVTFTRLLGHDPALDRVAANLIRRALD